MSVEIPVVTDSKRTCGECQLCCKLLPMPELQKHANERCRHQKFGVGCAIYSKRPMSCAVWSCRWLLNQDTADLRRPDRSHYVIDMMPDSIEIVNNETGARIEFFVIQVWVDPKYPNAHRDPALRAYLMRRADQDAMPAMIRYGSQHGFILFAPSLSVTGDWCEAGHDSFDKGYKSFVGRIHDLAEARRKEKA